MTLSETLKRSFNQCPFSPALSEIEWKRAVQRKIPLLLPDAFEDDFRRLMGPLHCGSDYSRVGDADFFQSVASVFELFSAYSSKTTIAIQLPVVVVLTVPHEEKMARS